MTEPEVEQVWDDFWRPIVERDGILDLERVKRELYDYRTIIKEVPRVYSHVTGGLISKPNTLAVEVIRVADDRIDTLVAEAVQEREDDNASN